jgi:hypothetical protein
MTGFRWTAMIAMQPTPQEVHESDCITMQILREWISGQIRETFSNF